MPHERRRAERRPKASKWLEFLTQAARRNPLRAGAGGNPRPAADEIKLSAVLLIANGLLQSRCVELVLETVPRARAGEK